jgi:hypothetical protein
MVGKRAHGIGPKLGLGLSGIDHNEFVAKTIHLQKLHVRGHRQPFLPDIDVGKEYRSVVRRSDFSFYMAKFCANYHPQNRETRLRRTKDRVSTTKKPRKIPSFAAPLIRIAGVAYAPTIT